MPAWLWLVLIGGGALLLAVLVAAHAVYRIAFRRRPGRVDPYERLEEAAPPYAEQVRCLLDETYTMAWEQVSIRSRDGLRLCGYFHAGRAGAPAVIACHGYRSMPYRDFCGGAPFLARQGCTVLMIDQRAHGESEGRTISFGIREQEDVVCWADYLAGRMGAQTPILLYGISMGAATVLMASARPLPPSVCGVVADCPYSTPEAILRLVGERRGLPMWLCLPLLRLGAWLWGGFSLRAGSPLLAVRQPGVPVLLLHGEADGFVPCEMSRALAAAGGARVRLLTFPRADHALSYLADRARYEGEVAAFLARCAGAPLPTDTER